MRYKSLPLSVRSSVPGPEPLHPSPSPVRPAPARRRLRDWLATIPIVILLTVLLLPFTAARAWTQGSLLVSSTELSALPTSGGAWDALKRVADGSLGTPDLTDQNDKHDVYTLGVAIVAARTGSLSYREKARQAIMGAVGTERPGADNSVLALGRQLGAYVLAADLIGLDGSDGATFRSWLSWIRTTWLGGHSRWYTLRGTADDSANNWGTFALASIIAADRYLGDSAAVARDWAVFKGYTDGSWPFRPTASYNTAWQCGSGLVPINPPCTKSGYDLDGLPVEDASRSAFPTPDAGYVNEALQGYVLQAILLQQAGYPAFAVGQDALRRVAAAMNRFGIWNATSVGRHAAWVINRFYGTTYPTQAAGTGRVFGYTDWLYGPHAPVMSGTPAPTPSTASTSAPNPLPSATPTPTPAPAVDLAAPPLQLVTQVTFRSASSGSNPTATTLTIERPAGLDDGDVMVASIDVRGQPAITPPSGWSLVLDGVYDTIMKKATYVRVARSSEPGTYTWTFSNAQAASGVIVAFSGVDRTDPVSAARGQVNGKSTLIQVPAVSVGSSSGIVVGFFGIARSTSITPPSGMAELGWAASTAGTYKVTSEAADAPVAAGTLDGVAATARDAGASIGHILVLRPAS